MGESPVRDISSNLITDSSLNSIINNHSITNSHYRINNRSPEWGMMLTLQNSLNLRIGTQSWKKYISAAFWNYISTPINFTITLFTALTAGQTGTSTSYLTEKQLFIMLFCSFLLSIVNTFFKLKEKAIINYEASKRYDEFGSLFDEIYYTPLTNENELLIRLAKYKELQNEINKYCQKENIDNVNYFTECIYICFRLSRCFFFEDNLKRINKSDRFWFLDGLSPDEEREKNNWMIDTKKYFLYDLSGQRLILDDEEKKEKRNKQLKQLILNAKNLKNMKYPYPYPYPYQDVNNEIAYSECNYPIYSKYEDDNDFYDKILFLKGKDELINKTQENNITISPPENNTQETNINITPPENNTQENKDDVIIDVLPR